MKSNTIILSPIYLLVILLAGLTAGCGNKALFDELATNKLKVVIKGTFESNSPALWNTTNFSGNGSDALVEDDSVNDVNLNTATISDIIPTTFYIDIAGLQLGKKRIGEYRQLFTAALTDSDPFFDGTGLVMKNDDPPEESFGNVSLFIRKMIFNNATQYYLAPSGTWTVGDAVQVLFHEKTIDGFDFNQLQVNTYYDSLHENADDINRIFPLNIPIDGGFVYSNNDEETVLEIRLVIKNFVKKYEYDYYNDDSQHAVYHYFGLSDWLRDVKADDVHIGGNVLAVARVYVPGKTATISGTTPSAGYVIAIPGDKNITDYLIPSANHVGARPARADANCLDKPPSVYLPAANNIESYLDYYLKYEQYKVRYNSFRDSVENSLYETPWNDYEDNVNDFKLPPLVTYTDGSSNYSITNVPIGNSYNLYFIPVAGVPYGSLPDSDYAGIVTYSLNPVLVDGNETAGF